MTMPLVDFVDRVYLPQRLGLRPRSARQLRTVARQFQGFTGPVPVSQITDDQHTAFLRHLLDIGMEGTTVNSRRRELWTLRSFAYRKRMTGEPPRDVPRAPEHHRTPEAWTVEEVGQLLSYSAGLPGYVGCSRAGAWWPALESLIYWTGARVGDALAAKSDSLDIVRATWRCRASKTGKEHLYDLHPRCVDALKGIYNRERAPLFAWPYSPNHLFVAFRLIVKRAGIRYSGQPRQLFYRLRRTNLSYCWAADPSIAVRQADHSSAEVTRAHYVDPSIAHARSARDVLPVPTFSLSRQLRLF